MDRLDQFRIFIRVAHAGGFTAAAEQLGLPRPTVSLAVQQLENRLGARLFNRTTRRISLTRDGEILLERASSLVSDSEELDTLFKPNAHELNGRLRVELPSRLARRLVAPALPDFLERHPALQIDLGSSDRTVDLVQDAVDCALRVGELASSSLVSRPLGHFKMINCASPSYLARYGMPRHPLDLMHHCTVGYWPPSSSRAALWEWHEEGKARAQAFAATVCANNAETYIACCLAGLGLIQIPAYDVQEHLENGELQEVLLDWPAPSMPVQLVYPHRRHLSRRVQVFGQWLAQTLAPFLQDTPGGRTLD